MPSVAVRLLCPNHGLNSSTQHVRKESSRPSTGWLSLEDESATVVAGISKGTILRQLLRSPTNSFLNVVVEQLLRGELAKWYFV